SDEQHWDRKITNVKSLGKHAVDDPTARDFLINHPSLHHTAMESMDTTDQDKVKLKSLTDPFVEPSKKLKHLSDLIKDENVPHSIKFAAADRVKGTDLEELAQNGLNRFKRKHYAEMSNE
ncbi:MAG TPA: hypothetical protein VFM18_19630, partial [Methanosarcina sp.]|nr:hypothetical protein [Methanosarcina sp.]